MTGRGHTQRSRPRTGDFLAGGLSVTWYTSGLARPERRLISTMPSLRTPACAGVRHVRVDVRSRRTFLRSSHGTKAQSSRKGWTLNRFTSTCEPRPLGTMMIGIPPSFSLGRGAPAGGGLAGLAAATGTGGAAGGGAACGGMAGGRGCTASARKEAFVSMPSSSTSRVPSLSCQNFCSWTSLYLRGVSGECVRRWAREGAPV